MNKKQIIRSTALFLATLSAFIPALFAADEPVERDMVRTKLTIEDEPWLRLCAGGHTTTVQALAFTPDSERLCSAGLDKDVFVWNLSNLRDLKRTFLRERTIRWQVARGLRGSIYALASAQSDGLLAIGGYGAMGSLGDILLIDPVTGTLKKVLEGHRQTVCSLAFSPDGKRLVSTSTDGQVLLWDREGGKPVTIRETDAQVLQKHEIDRIVKLPNIRPIVFLGNKHLVVPEFSIPQLDSVGWGRWQLIVVDIDNPKNNYTLGNEHFPVVSTLAATADGNQFISADLSHKLYLWKKANDRFVGVQIQTADQSPAQNNFLSSCISPDGQTLLTGTAIDDKTKQSQLLIWNLASQKIIGVRNLSDHVQTCAFSPDGKRFAYVGGKNNEIFVENLADAIKDNSTNSAAKPVALRGTGQKIFKVAFPIKEPFYRVAFGTKFRDQGFNNSGDLQETFDPAELALGPEQKLEPSEWLSSEWLAGGWTAKPYPNGSLELFYNQERMGNVSIKKELPNFNEGRIRCYCWIPDQNGKPFAIAVGTELQNSIYVCTLPDHGDGHILRHFRGHNDHVTSLCVSRDLRYLVSGAADGTICFWSLSEFAGGKEPLSRWGADFAVEGGKLIAKKVNPAGPLFHKGLRDGDMIKEIRWPADNEDQTAAAKIVDKAVDDPTKILAALREMPWGTQVVFAPTRDGKDRPAFQLLPAWQPLATLFVSTNREWAFWTPSGYYDASMNGHRLFGWQVNRGLERLPDFYRADQFYRKLERPDIMQRLLTAGSLQAAFQLAAAPPPPQFNESLPGQIAATPRVEILSPAAGATIKEASMLVRARVEVPQGGKLLRSKVFANGVAGKNEQLVSDIPLPSGRELTYQWEVPLPQEPKNLIQVMVDTDAPTAAFGDVLIDHQAPPANQLPKLYIVALGVNKYGDPEIQPLSFSVADAEAVVETLRKQTQELYTLDDVSLLTNQQVTPDEFRTAIKKLSEKLQSVAGPDDLLLLFLAGHGIVDEESKKYYFVGYDFTMADFQKGDYKNCISWDDFRSLADVPCRKLALLDTCHSGAIQPPRSGDLKTAVRQLQEDVIFTVTASTGEQRSAEKPSWGHGAFTKCMLEALGGKADTTAAGFVTLDELVAYLKHSVPQITEGLQTPTAAPDDILPFTALPLTKVRSDSQAMFDIKK